ncbi:TRAP transporter small permease [Celeribacter indicus]|uniref:TRAP transporter small permease protein n=1 Tax=Celeribacter indicus TaxID=1208324 RepID=A0A0B5E5B8_9RHOB|nr:TRAP transporter small permease [Celeribacter indicus]AJE47552.1 putative DctQ (C4-dicarboxylate permease, small subunit) [Celeribacter indicus]SDW09951.1 TRAP-type C4-dicarboxylate transport system, small permease component [Celeribacter indicus]
MQTLHRACRLATRAGAVFAAAALAVLALMLVLEVVLNSAFRISQPWATEYSVYLLGASLFAGSGWVFTEAGHIRVTLLSDRLSAPLARGMAVVTEAIGLAVASFAAWHMTLYALASLERGSTSLYPSATPLWIPQMMLAVSLWLICTGIVACMMETLGFVRPRAAAPDLAREI